MTEQLLSEQPENHEVLKEHPVIVVDIDGVLFDTPQHAVERWNTIHRTDYKVEDIFDHNAKHNKDLFRHWHEDGQETDQETGEKFDDGFYGAQKDVANYLLIPSAREVLAKLKAEYGASLHALTARDKGNLEDVTLTALGEHFGIGEDEESLIDELHFSGDPDFIGETQADKGTILRDKLGAHIMVEDSIANAQSSKKANVATFVLSRAYNQTGHDWLPEETAPDWDTLYHLISESLEKQGFRKLTKNDEADFLFLDIPVNNSNLAQYRDESGRIEEAVDRLEETGAYVDRYIVSSWKDKALLDVLETKDIDIAEAIAHTSEFNRTESHLFHETVELPVGHGSKRDGKLRRAESGDRLDFERLRESGINPAKVLFFRVTQPSNEPVPELYWTTDFMEVRGGLGTELGDQRATSVILIDTLDSIAKNGGLMRDINDDSGVAVRQLGLDGYDQSSAMGRI